ncbi:pirin family protein [Legionella rowbothamii]|uniref:pirin family protein n=1 Tax=Legionella rowbothamii TaxID=96229 RepID=UPI0010558FDB|nr:pirin family protein [Legionella rowbothamii]
MSDLITKAQLSDSKDCPVSSVKPVHQMIKTRHALLGDKLIISRALPTRERRMIGAWCFLDHFGPLHLQQGHEFDVAPHPHIGLQTFTWIMDGEILHQDSLGSRQLIKAGQVNLMTAGRGIAHSEESIHSGIVLQGVQLWIALPDLARHMAPDFKHYPEVPVIEHEGLVIDLMVGELLGVKAPVSVYSPLIGLDINAQKAVQTKLPMNPRFEYGILPLDNEINIEGTLIDPSMLLYLGCGRSELELNIPQKARFLLIGGEPFNEEILIWWNFVARTKQEIIDATNHWNNHTYFDEVQGYLGKRTSAPIMP